MKFIWPPLVKVMEDRQKKIADGIAAGEQGQKTFEFAKKEASQLLVKAKQDSAHIIDQANTRSARIIDDAKAESRHQGKQMIEAAQTEIEQQVLNAKEKLKQNVGNLAILAAEKILEKNIDRKGHEKMLEALISTI